MEKHSREEEIETRNPASFLAGLLLGSLAGAVTMLFFAPQSGEKTRQQIRRNAIELRDQTSASVEDALAQVRTRAGKIKADISGQAMELKQQGQDALVEQLDRVSAALKPEKR
ncbi:MAG: YtxH domain-containing protein [Anaerolineales bacterium]